MSSLKRWDGNFHYLFVGKILLKIGNPQIRGISLYLTKWIPCYAPPPHHVTLRPVIRHKRRYVAGRSRGSVEITFISLDMLADPSWTISTQQLSRVVSYSPVNILVTIAVNILVTIADSQLDMAIVLVRLTTLVQIRLRLSNIDQTREEVSLSAPVLISTTNTN
jgi:hypothetical protein